MSPGPAGLQDCTGGGWWAIMWQIVNQSLVGGSALGTGTKLASTISPLPWAGYPQSIFIPLLVFSLQSQGSWDNLEGLQCFQSQ